MPTFCGSCPGCTFRTKRPWTDCNHGSKCRNPFCKFAHASPCASPGFDVGYESVACRFGIQCKRDRCEFAHPSKALKCKEQVRRVGDAGGGRVEVVKACTIPVGAKDEGDGPVTKSGVSRVKAHIIFCVDNSGSMRTCDAQSETGSSISRAEAVACCCRKFVKMQDAEQGEILFSHLTFDDGAKITFCLKDGQLASEELEQLVCRPGGGTNFAAAWERLEEMTASTALDLVVHVIFLSDGRPGELGPESQMPTLGKEKLKSNKDGKSYDSAPAIVRRLAVNRGEKFVLHALSIGDESSAWLQRLVAIAENGGAKATFATADMRLDQGKPHKQVLPAELQHPPPVDLRFGVMESQPAAREEEQESCFHQMGEDDDVDNGLLNRENPFDAVNDITEGVPGDTKDDVLCNREQPRDKTTNLREIREKFESGEVAKVDAVDGGLFQEELSHVKLANLTEMFEAKKATNFSDSMGPAPRSRTVPSLADAFSRISMTVQEGVKTRESNKEEIKTEKTTTPKALQFWRSNESPMAKGQDTHKQLSPLEMNSAGDLSQTWSGPSDAKEQILVACAADGDGMVPASEVLVHAQGSTEDVLEFLRDIKETWHGGAAAGVRDAETVGAATRTFSSHDEWKKLAQRVQKKEAKVVVRKLFLYSGQCSVMQEIWIQDKTNPDAVRYPLKSYAVAHAHHHWHTRVCQLEDIGPEHLAIVDAINLRHLSDHQNARYQGDNPFENTFIEQSGGATLKVFPEGWTCQRCGQTNLSHHSDCRQPDCSGKRPGPTPPRCAAWNWRQDPSRNEDLALILKEADAALEWRTGGVKSMTRVAGDVTDGGGGYAIVLEKLMSMSRKKVYPEKKKEEVGTTSVHESPLGTVPAAAQPMLDSSLLPDPAPMQLPFSVLFVGANMEHHAQLKIKEECQIIRKELQSRFGEDAWRPYATFRADCFADPASFMHDVMEIGPGILQFSCHGETRGLWFSQGFTEASAIVDAIRAHNREVEAEGGQRIRLVVVNACMSGPLAQALCECVDFVIGHGHSEVGDEEALTFSRTLYYSLGRGMSLDSSFKAAKLASEPFRLYHSFNPKKFILPVPGLRSPAAGAAVVTGPSTRSHGNDNEDLPESDCNELVCFLKDKGLSAIAARFSEAMGMELVEHLGKLQKKDLDDPDLNFLKPWQKKTLVELVRDITARSASLRNSDLNASDQSAAETEIDGDGTASEGGDDTDTPFDTVLAKNSGDPAEFQDHMADFIRDFLAYMEAGIEADDEWNTYDVDLSNTGNRRWTWCMLLWIWFARYASKQRHESLLSQWHKACNKQPTEGNLLELLTTILESSTALGDLWSREKFEFLECKKQHAASIFVTDSIVQKRLQSHLEIQQMWSSQVVGSWFDDDESADDFLLRANRFLRHHAECSICISEGVIETQSYVAFMRMTPLASILLFEYLEARKAQDTASLGAAGGSRSVFRMFVSSSRCVFSLTETDVPARHAKPAVLQGLQCLARLSTQAWELLGPMKTARECVEGEDQAVERNPDFHLKAKDLDSDDDKSSASAKSATRQQLASIVDSNASEPSTMDKRSLAISEMSQEEPDVASSAPVGVGGVQAALSHFEPEPKKSFNFLLELENLFDERSCQYRSKEELLAAVRQDGLALRHASEEMRGDKEVVLAAVQQAGLALQYASKELCGHRQVVLAAAQQDGWALQYASDEMRRDVDVVLAAVKQHVVAMHDTIEEMEARILRISGM